MSYVLTEGPPQGRDALRQAVAGAGRRRRIRQNLALAVGLQGRLDEAEKIAARRPAAGTGRRQRRVAQGHA